MDRNCDTQFGAAGMEQPRMTSALVMYVEAGTEQSSDYLLGFESRQFGRHALRGPTGS